MNISIILTILLLVTSPISSIPPFDFIIITKKFLLGKLISRFFDEEKYEIICSDHQPRTKIITKDGFVWHSDQPCEVFLDSDEEGEFSDFSDY